jgi:threonine synthase
MRFVSTRGAPRAVTLSEAVRAGIAPDGGLYVPERMPRLDPGDFSDARTLQAVARRWIEPFCEGDPLAGQLGEVIEDAFSFPAPLMRIAAEPLPVSVLELFHGPTAAFKDFGARFLAACLERQPHDPARPVTILVATSGDTGGAVAAAFHGRPWARVVVLYPQGLVSPRQEKQLTCWGGNVRALAVEGTFDDCQRMVKEAFADPALRERFELSSANSINVGRLLPQAAYYAAASLERFRADGAPPSFIVPSGNLGNVLACLWARTAGLPIGEVELAHNANRTVPDFLGSGDWQPRASVATLASAMDVGNPSNMERLRHLHPDWRELARSVRAHAVTDDQIRLAIRRDFGEWGETWCPHTATAAHVYRELPPERRAAHHWVLVATAHPAKFESIVEPLIGRAVDIPPALAELLGRPSHADRIDASLAALRRALLGA